MGKANTPTKNLFRVVDGLKREDDPLSGWGTENPEYDEREFYVGSTDGKGHNTNVQVPIPPNIMGALSSMVATREIPAYRSVQDFVRDAIVHRLHQLAILDLSDDPELQRARAQEITSSRIAAEVRALELDREQLAQAEEGMRVAASEGDAARLRVLLGQAAEQADRMNEPWDRRLVEIVQRYRKTLESMNRENGKANPGG